MDRGCDIRFRKNSSFSFSILKGNGTGGGRDIFEPGSQVLDGRVAGQLLSELVDSLRGLVLVLVDVALEQAALPSGPGSVFYLNSSPPSPAVPPLLLPGVTISFFQTLPKVQRTRGLSSSYQSYFFRSYHKFKHKY